MAHRNFTANLPVAEVAIWEEICSEWENAPYPRKDMFNPFKVCNECEFLFSRLPILLTIWTVLLVAQVTAELAAEDITVKKKERHRTGPAKFLLSGFDIQESQWVSI